MKAVPGLVVLCFGAKPYLQLHMIICYLLWGIRGHAESCEGAWAFMHCRGHTIVICRQDQTVGSYGACWLWLALRQLILAK